MPIEFTGVYVHFPHCDVKCDYCDFFSIAQAEVDQDFYPKYLARLSSDLEKKKKLLTPQNRIGSIFFGGGTPSKVPVYVINEVLLIIKSQLADHLSKQIEISLEANPESLSERKLFELYQAGVNRLNVGIQTFDPKLIKYLGRLYSKEVYDNVLNWVVRSSFENYGFDLIYGIPGQGDDQVGYDLQLLIEANPKHISAYSLTIEKGTKLESQILSHRKLQISSRRQVRHQDIIQKKLTKAEFKRYEISNYAKNGYQCRHNLAYWKYKSYIGLGVAAHSFINGERIYEPRSLQKYLQAEGLNSEKEKRNLDLFINTMRLRTFQNFGFYRELLGENRLQVFKKTLKQFAADQMIDITEKGFTITDRGLLFSDSLIARAYQDQDTFTNRKFY